MKHFRKILTVCLCGLFLFFLIFISRSSETRFENFCDSIFREELSANSLTLHYTVSDPEAFGIDSSRITLGAEESSFSERLHLIKNFLKLQTIARGSLSDENKMLYDLLQYEFDIRLDSFRFSHLHEPLVPSIGIQAQLPVLLAEYTFRSEKDVVNYLQLLLCVPKYFDSILSCEQEKLAAGTFMDRETAEEICSYCRNFPSGKNTHFLNETFRERLDALTLPEQKKKQYLEKNAFILEKKVFPAYEKLADFLTEHKNSGISRNGLSDYPDGTDYYRWLLRSEIGTDLSFQEIGQKLDDALADDARTIARLTRKHPQLLKERQHISINISDPSALTKQLARQTARDFPEIEDVSLTVRSVPKSMEQHLSPAFYLVPPVDTWKDNVVYLNNRALSNDISFFTTLAHETYPGHLYQTVYENSRNPHPVRRLLYFGGYTEGWATYAEQLSYFYAPISAELALLLSSLRAMTLNIYAHLDLYVHTCGWTEAQCAAYLKNFGITDKNAVHEMFMLVKQQPANYLKYYLGYLELCSLKETAQLYLGEKFRLKEFHDFILSCGPAPFELLEKKLEEWLHSSE